MPRPVILSLSCLTLVLLAFPLTLGKPGLPPSLKADEPAYYLAALSLARDGDLRMDAEDADRVFQEFPYGSVSNLILMSDDGWRTAHYGKPYVYSLLAAPLAGPFGANGMLLFNMVCLVAVIWMGTVYLSRFNPPWIAALYSAGFFLLSLVFTYGFWLHPEIFNIAAVTAALFLGFHRFEAGWWGRWGAMFLSGAALMAAVHAKPMILALALPLVWLPLRERRWGRAAAWVAGAGAGALAIVGVSVALTGQPTSYLGVERQGVTVCEPGVLPFEQPEAGGPSTAAIHSPTGGAWSWIFRVPEVNWPELTANLGYFLWGRHTGLALYMPFAVLSVALFLVHGRRSTGRWLVLAALAVVALFFIVFIPDNWQGGGGFVGNRYFVNVYPAFLFLVTRVRPLMVVPAGYAVAGIFFGAMFVAPFGAPVPEPTLQAHTRNTPLRYFPLELTLRNVPGYHHVDVGSYRFIGRKDQVLPRGNGLWLRGADRVELQVLGAEPMEEGVFQLSTPVAENRIAVRLGADEEELELGSAVPSGPVRRITLEPEGSTHRGSRLGASFVGHRMIVEIGTGRPTAYVQRFPPHPCGDPIFGYDAAQPRTFPLGAELLYLGTGEGLDEDVFGVDWLEVTSRERVVAGQTFYPRVRLANSSSSPWKQHGAAGVSLSYHWYDASGEQVRFDGLRTALPLPLDPGEEAEVLQEVEAPGEPGRYVLELDPVFEHVDWFSRRGAEPFRVEVTVVPAPDGPAAEEGPGGADGAGGE